MLWFPRSEFGAAREPSGALVVDSALGQSDFEIFDALFGHLCTPKVEPLQSSKSLHSLECNVGDGGVLQVENIQLCQLLGVLERCVGNLCSGQTQIPQARKFFDPL